MNAPQKMTLDELRSGMRIFLDFPRTEEVLRREVASAAESIALGETQNGGRPPLDVLDDYLREDTNIRLQFIIGLAGGSLERMKRVFAAMFPGESWSAIRNDGEVRRRVAAFLIHPDDAEVFVPRFVRQSFALPADWIHLLQDARYIRAIAHNLKQSRYAVATGNALEDAVNAAVASCGYDSEKGAVHIVDDKEVDIAVPTVAAPRVLIMSSFQLTTSSSQTSKANEQTRMYQNVQAYNQSRRRRGQPAVLFVNIIDGGGWLERARDLETMWRGCDYCFPHSRLDGLAEVLRYYV